MFYLKFMCFFTTFIKKLKNFIKKQRRYEFLKIIVFWLNGLKILRHEVPTVQCWIGNCPPTFVGQTVQNGMVS